MSSPSTRTSPAPGASPGDAPEETRPTVIGGAMNVCILALVLAAVVTLALAAPFGPTGEGYQAAEPQSVTEWQLTVAGADQGTVTLPATVATDANPGDEVVLSSTVTASEGDYLYFYDSCAPVRVYANGMLVGEYGQARTLPAFMRDPAPSGVLLDLGDAAGEVTLELVFSMPQDYGMVRLEGVRVGSLDAIRHSLMRGSGWLSFVSMAVLTVGLVALLLAYFVGHRGGLGAAYFWLGVFTLCAGTWVFGSSEFTTLLLRRPVLLNALVFLGFFGSAIPYARLVRSLTREGPSRLMDALTLAVEVYALAAFALQLTGRVQFQRSVRPYLLLLALLLGYLTLRMVAWARRQGGEGRRALGLTCLAATVLQDVALAAELANYCLWHVMPDAGFYAIGMVGVMLALVMGLAFELRRGLRAQRERTTVEARLREVERRVSDERRWYRNFSESRRDLSRQRAELRDQLSAIRAYAEDGDAAGVVAYVDDLETALWGAAQVGFSDEEAVDSVVSYYVRQAREDGIEDVQVRLGVTEELPPTLEDELCAIVGNLLQVGLDLARRARAEGAAPFVRMRSALLRESLLNVSMEASCPGAAPTAGSDVTLRSIEAVAKANDGNARFEHDAEAGLFRASVILRVGEQETPQKGAGRQDGPTGAGGAGTSVGR